MYVLTARRILVIVVLALAVVAGVQPGTGAHAQDPSVRAARAAYLVPTSESETGFGHFSETPRSDAVALRRAFGSPSSASRRGAAECILRWRRFGITATVVAYGSLTKPCRRGYFVQARLTKRRWHTASGVHRGVTEAVARRAAVRRCTRARCGTRSGYELGEHRIDCAAGRFPNVIAPVRHGRVTSLVVNTHGCE
jgi:hypothetical protein